MPDFLFNVPRDVLIQLLRSESTREGYSDTAARVSLLLDLDAESPRSQGEYARIWGWTKKQVRLRWDGIVEDVTAWATNHGRLTSGGLAPACQAWLDGMAAASEEMARRRRARTCSRTRAQGGAHDGHTEGHTKRPADAIRAGPGHSEGHTEGTGGAQHTIPEPSEPTEHSPSPRAGARGERVPDGRRPESREHARLYLAGLDAERHLDGFWDWYEGNGWVQGKARAPIRSWQAAARAWVRRQQSYDDEPATSGHNRTNRNGHRTSTSPGDAFARLQGI